MYKINIIKCKHIWDIYRYKVSPHNEKVATQFQYELRTEMVLLTSYRYKSVCFKNIPE